MYTFLIDFFSLAGDAGYKPYVTAEPDMVSIALEGNEDFLVIGCDGLWDTIGVDEAAFIVLQYIHHESKWRPSCFRRAASFLLRTSAHLE